MLTFGVNVMSDPPSRTILSLTQMAEAQGFSQAWLWDSHVLWMEPYPLLTMIALNTNMTVGTCVTNPVTRDPSVTASAFATLNEMTGGRTIMGIGRGDSSRRVMGKPPTTLATLEQAIVQMRALAAGEEVVIDGQPVQMKWAHGTLPIYVAAYGPKALRLAGRVGDGVILQFADPFLVKWCLGFVKEGCAEAGRDFSTFKVLCAAPSYISDDMARARDQVRWFPALVSNHVVDLVSRYPIDELPPELTRYVTNRPGYDYQDHGRVGAHHAGFVTDDIVDRFCVIGSPAQCAERLHDLQEAGMHEFNIYLMTEDREHTLTEYGRHIVPQFV